MNNKVTIAELDRVCAILSAELKLKIIPGRSWGWDRAGRRVVVPRGSFLNRPPAEVIGDLWRCVWHAAKSWGDLREFDVAVDAAVNAEDLLGVRAVHPRWILNVVMAAERERVEVLARQQARYLEKTYLPVRWQGHRAQEAVVDAMALYEHGTTADAARYWARTAVAVSAVAARVLERDQLPADMPWSETTFYSVRDLVKAPSYDELLLAVEALVPDFVRAHLEALAQQNEPEEDEPEDEGDPQDGQGDPDKGEGDDPSDESQDENDQRDDKSSEDDDAQTESGDGEADEARGDDDQPGSAEEDSPDNAGDDDQPDAEDEDAARAEAPSADASEDEGEAPSAPDPTAGIPREVLDAIADMIEAIGADPTAIDWFEADSNAAPQEAAKDIEAAIEEAAASGEYEFMQNGGPAWAAVSRSNAAIVEPLRRTLLDFLAANDSGELERHQRCGRLDVRTVAKPKPDPRNAFLRRTVPTERSYGLALVVDRSGSTSIPTNGAPAEQAFGPGDAKRWHVGTRMVVGLTEALQRIDNTEIALFAFDSTVEKLKGIKDRLSEPDKQRIMDGMVPRNCTTVSPALEAALDDLRTSKANEKLMIVLTDGEFEASEAADIRQAVARADREGVGLAVLTIGCSAESAASFVGSKMATEITPETAGAVVRGHFRRLFPPKAA
jgi:hypothetical protein